MNKARRCKIFGCKPITVTWRTYQEVKCKYCNYILESFNKKHNMENEMSKKIKYYKEVTSCVESFELYKLNVKQDSLYYWSQTPGEYSHELLSNIEGLNYYYSAFTATELLEILSNCINYESFKITLEIDINNKSKYRITYDTYINSRKIYITYCDKKLCDVLAIFLIRLISDKLIDYELKFKSNYKFCECCKR